MIKIRIGFPQTLTESKIPYIWKQLPSPVGLVFLLSPNSVNIWSGPLQGNRNKTRSVHKTRTEYYTNLINCRGLFPNMESGHQQCQSMHVIHTHCKLVLQHPRAFITHACQQVLPTFNHGSIHTIESPQGSHESSEHPQNQQLPTPCPSTFGTLCWILFLGISGIRRSS